MGRGRRRVDETRSPAEGGERSGREDKDSTRHRSASYPAAESGNRGVTIAVATTLSTIQTAATTKAAPGEINVHTRPTAADETKSPSD
jgi:hypothetical protein